MNRRGRTALGLLSLLVFVAIGALVFSLPAAAALDGEAMLALNHLQVGGAGRSVLVAAALYGREYFWAAVVGAMLLFGDRETKLMSLELAVLFAAGVVAGEALKATVYRARPPLALSDVFLRIPVDADSSFPSGHALITSIGGAFALLKFRKKGIAALLALEAGVVCFARVYVGVHFPLDVVGGAALGISVVALGLVVEDGPARAAFDRVAGLLARALRNGPLVV